VRGYILFSSNSVNFAKGLRQRQTDAERRLWYHLRNRKVEGFKFRRQHSIGHYIVDFVCLEKRLVIEIDGGQHNWSHDQVQDKRRTDRLMKEGYQVVRFWNNEVLTNTEGVLELIRQLLIK
jgi:very-short-patch-repair endonuclease